MATPLPSSPLARTTALCDRCAALFVTPGSLARLASDDSALLAPVCRFSELEGDGRCALCALVRRGLLASSGGAGDAEARRDPAFGDKMVQMVLLYQIKDEDLLEEEEDEEEGQEEHVGMDVVEDLTIPSTLLCYLEGSNLVARLAWYSIPDAVGDILGLDLSGYDVVVKWRELGGFYASADYWKRPCFVDGVLSMIDNCGRQHAQCLTKDTPPLPTIIVDLSMVDLQEKIFLHVADHNQCGNYVALSYCWGGPQKLVTTAANLESHIQEGIQLDLLPMTILEAVRVTASLGIRYLWIDALCIVQDDDTAKAIEIERMGDIYTNATMVLLASGTSRAVEDGFLDPFNDIAIVPFLVQGRLGEETIVPVCLAPEAQESPHLDTRVWTFQERQLARRILEFGGATGVSLSCDEAFLSFLPDHRWVENTTALAEKNKDKQSLVSTWHGVMEEYSLRQLTFASDRLPALAGYASKHNKDASCYFAGLWSSQIIDDLMWKASPASPRVKIDLEQYRSPGWSWISVLDHEPHDARPICVSNNLRLQMRLGGHSESEATLVGHSIQLAHASAPFGRVVGGTITLAARMVRLADLSSSDTTSAVDRDAILLLCNYALRPEQEELLHFVRLKIATRWGFGRSGAAEFGDGGLLVLPAPPGQRPEGNYNDDPVFMRVGTFWDWWSEVDGVPMVDWDSVEIQNVTLI
ncbi:heterokaryon incompatibility protein-domain-containing protein [Biscogniauxia sp. FL1348]|nr:heterokaryon incompatibility protein-domain-containing protein [Biscogniauxia sp. FL1348]